MTIVDTNANSTHTDLLLLAGPKHALRSDTHTPRQFLLLPHPRTGVPTYFLPACSNDNNAQWNLSDCDEMYEMQAVRNEKSSRSWFLNGDKGEDVAQKGWVIQDGTLHVLFPIDPLFLLLSILAHIPPEKYLSKEDLFDEAATTCYSRQREQYSTIATRAAKSSNTTPIEGQDHNSSTWHDILRFSLSRSASQALQDACDVQSLTSGQQQPYYRLSRDKVEAVLKGKVQRLVGEEQFEKFPATLGKALAKSTEWNASEEEKLKGRVDVAMDIIRGYVPMGSVWDTDVLPRIGVQLLSHD